MISQMKTLPLTSNYYCLVVVRIIGKREHAGCIGIGANREP